MRFKIQDETQFDAIILEEILGLFTLFQLPPSVFEQKNVFGHVIYSRLTH